MKFNKNTTLAEIIATDDVELVSFAQAIINLSDKQADEIDAECGDVDVAVRWAQLVMFPSACDGEVSERESKYIVKQIKEFIKEAKLEEGYEPEDIVTNAIEVACDDNVFLNTLKIFKKFFPLGALKNISILQTKAAGHDDLAEEEGEMVRIILLYWYGVFTDDEIEEMFTDEGDE